MVTVKHFVIKIRATITSQFLLLMFIYQIFQIGRMDGWLGFYGISGYIMHEIVKEIICLRGILWKLQVSLCYLWNRQ